MAPPVFKTGLAANIVAGGFDSLPPPPLFPADTSCRCLTSDADLEHRHRKHRPGSAPSPARTDRRDPMRQSMLKCVLL